MVDDVEFVSDGVVLRGRLYGAPTSTRSRPAIVMAHGFSATITMATDKYAEAFAEAGLVVLLYDHAGFGGSDGAPRQVINPWVQARGYQDAVSYARTVTGVDPSRVALWGDVTPDAPAPFHPGLCSPHLRVPSLWLIAPTDEIPGANPTVSRRAYESPGGPKQLLETEGGHFGLLYWPSELFDLAVSAQCRFLREVLAS